MLPEPVPPWGVGRPEKHLPASAGGKKSVSPAGGQPDASQGFFFPPLWVVGLFCFFFNSIQHFQAWAQRCFSREQPGKLVAAPGPAGPSSAQGNRDKSFPHPREKVHWAFSCKHHRHPWLGASRGMRWDHNTRLHPTGSGRWLPSRGLMAGCFPIYFFCFNFLNPRQPLWASSSLSFVHRAAKPQGCYVRMDGWAGRPCHHPQTSKAAPGGRHHHRDGIRDTVPPFHQG